MKTKSYSNLTCGLLGVFCLLIFIYPGIAQKPVTVNITKVKAYQITTPSLGNHWEIEITFDTAFDTSIGTENGFLTDPSNYKIFDFTTSQPVKINGNPIPVKLPNGSKGSRVRLIVDAATPIIPSNLYHLYVFNLTFDGNSLDPTVKLQAAITIIPVSTPTPQTPP